MSPAESAALSVLQTEGIQAHLAAAYIGRARALARTPTDKLSILSIVEQVRKLHAADHLAAQTLDPQSDNPTSPTGFTWLSEYAFWHKIIVEEVERLRFNEGYEPIELDLYPIERKAANSYGGVAYLGKTQIGHHQFQAIGSEAFDENGVKILRIEIRAKKQP